MPRDISGNFTLPAGNPVVGGTIISTTWANPTLSDVGQNITDSLDRLGRGGMLAALRLTDGSAAAPALAWSSETGSGLYRVGAGVMGMSVLVAEVSRWSAGQFSTVLGTVGAPSHSFTGDLNTGMYSPGADQIGLSTAGALRLSVNAGGAVLPGADNSQSFGSTSLRWQAINSAVFADGVNGNLIDSASATARFASGSAWTAANISTGGTTRLTINSTGNVVINAPSSGDGLRIDGPVQIRRDTGTLTFRNAADTLNVGSLQFSNSSSAILSVTGAQDLNIQTNSSTRLTVSAAGNVSINAPSSGVPLTISPLSGANGVNLAFATSGTFAQYTRFQNTGGSGYIGLESSVGGAITVGATGYDFVISTDAVTGVVLGTNNLARLRASGAGNVTINAPSSGNALTVAGFAGSDTALFNGGTSGSFRVTDRGLPYGTSIHNNAGPVTGTTNQYIASGTYTPGLNGSTNLTAITLREARWIRVGNVVTVSGSIQFTITTGGISTSIQWGVPIASALPTENLSGTFAPGGSGVTAQATAVTANGTADWVSATWLSINTVVQTWRYTYTYVIT